MKFQRLKFALGTVMVITILFAAIIIALGSNDNNSHAAQSSSVQAELLAPAVEKNQTIVDINTTITIPSADNIDQSAPSTPQPAQDAAVQAPASAPDPVPAPAPVQVVHIRRTRAS